MTLNDIIVAALTQLDRGHDSQTLSAWRDKLTRFANEAVCDIATVIHLRRSDPVTVEDGAIDLAALPYCATKLRGLHRKGARLAFTTGPSTTLVRVLAADGPAIASYEYLPNDMQSPTDRPGLPGHCHSMIVTYVVARERASGDVASQRGASVYFDLYKKAKRRLSATMGETDSAFLFNKFAR